MPAENRVLMKCLCNYDYDGFIFIMIRTASRSSLTDPSSAKPAQGTPSVSGVPRSAFQPLLIIMIMKGLLSMGKAAFPPDFSAVVTFHGLAAGNEQ